jgi:hypothetical protein
VIKLAVLPARAVGLFQLENRDVVGIGERPHVATKTVADGTQQRRGRDRLAEVPGDEPHDLPADLKARHVRVEVEPVDALHIERHMTLKHVVDVRHARAASHRVSIQHDGRLCLPNADPATRGEAGKGGPPPSR